MSSAIASSRTVQSPSPTNENQPPSPNNVSSTDSNVVLSTKAIANRAIVQTKPSSPLKTQPAQPIQSKAQAVIPVALKTLRPVLQPIKIHQPNLLLRPVLGQASGNSMQAHIVMPKALAALKPQQMAPQLPVRVKSVATKPNAPAAAKPHTMPSQALVSGGAKAAGAGESAAAKPKAKVTQALVSSGAKAARSGESAAAKPEAKAPQASASNGAKVNVVVNASGIAMSPAAQAHAISLQFGVWPCVLTAEDLRAGSSVSANAGAQSTALQFSVEPCVITAEDLRATQSIALQFSAATCDLSGVL